MYAVAHPILVPLRLGRARCPRIASVAILNYYLDDDPHSAWPLVEDELQKRLPLKDLRWLVPGAHVEVRCAELNNFALLPGPAVNVVVPTGALKNAYVPEMPFARILFVLCGSQKDYDSHVRTEMKNWVSHLPDESEYVIVYVSRPGDAARKQVSFFNVFSQMRKEFQAHGLERYGLPPYWQPFCHY